MSSQGIASHFDLLKKLNPLAFMAIEPRVVAEQSARHDDLANLSRNEFTSEGRGADYLDSIQLSLLARSEGVMDLLGKMHPNGCEGLSPSLIICDLLAGDGYVNKVAHRILGEVRCPTFINSDISQFMVDRCIRDGLFAIWQSAADPYCIRDGSVDGVLMAYGTHHIPRALRATAVQASARILRPGGILVLHDFEEGSPTARWFADVVSTHSVTPHEYPHFTAGEVLDLFASAQFDHITVQRIADPFVMVGANKQSALQLLAEYVVKMYGLEELRSDPKRVLELLDNYFGLIVTPTSCGQFEARITRNALVGSGRRL
ncbi:methyltransferase domain-containing protein [Mesorhizobium sp. M7A.F.Ca.CA.001.07.2.1]|uniref:class I SAM-dependent methyltransferase n=1 Tax=Mesorhizobium TaxID=68287 RepID=UPI000FCCA93D|nr:MULTISPECIES: methyltransferase domain-containing protein [Mesorhizobium]RVB44373.1 methyltransferase domain-containing protein [Mesorhizobium sp. M7A.F.Ca.CA.004.05.1.1]RWN88448.1 MAG: methyltransferase domain-containing protein [Mesorhizobium sp.]MCF6127881.1 class I SAM-dependent methyltransferase [Mesorhizobium ciceri]MCQ8818559.1 class I SAM-dependent methyltransferase [Mesorhizobium sp. SEMIA396]RUU82167.1 methyltransferase domain-containing protein [Mesorhizobium sp. M7A.F.Ca.MR.362.